MLSAALAFSKQSRLAVLLQSVAASARSLLVFACTQGWAATARIVLPAACMDLGSAAAVVAALEEQLPAGMTLLLLAVSSQCVELVSLCLLCGGVGRGWPAHVSWVRPCCVLGRRFCMPLMHPRQQPECWLCYLSRYRLGV